MTSTRSRNITSLPAPGSGQLQLDLLAGPTISDCGQQASHASRSRSREKVLVSTTSGICGPTSFASSVPGGRLASWESRLRERLARIGSTECALIWREKVTKHGWSYSRLSPWTPPMSGSGNIGSPWPTPKAANAGPDFAKIERSATVPSLQTVMAGISYWPTPSVANATGGQSSRSGDRKGELLLGGMMRTALPWVTPSARDWKDTPGMAAERPDGQEPDRSASTADGGDVADAAGDGREQGVGAAAAARYGRLAATANSAANGSFWSDHEWIVCHDGKARRTKPGLRLLVDGMAGRIHLWRLAGNSINAVLAAEVLAALLETEVTQ